MTKGKWQRVVSLGGILVLLVGIIGACGGDDESAAKTQSAAPPVPAAAAVPAATGAPAAPSPVAAAPTAPSDIAAWQFEQEPESGMPQYGGFMRLAADDAPTLNPYDVAPTAVLTMVSSLYSTLVEWQWEGGDHLMQKHGPALAESWESSSDGLVWTFKIRDGVKFHDGTPLTSADVKATYDFLVAPEGFKPPGGSYTRPFISSVEAPDSKTVVLNLKGPAPVLLHNLAVTYTMIAPKAHMPNDIEWFNTNANGTGPFTMGKWERGISWQVDRNDDYWNEGLPYLDGKKFFVIGDSAARLAAFETKKIDRTGQPTVTPNQLNDLLTRYGDELELLKVTGGSYHYVIYNATKPPFDDVRVRKAVYMWLDRKAFMDKSQQGVGFLGEWLNPLRFPPYGTPYEDLRDKDLAFKEDKTEARAKALELLGDAGYTQQDLGQFNIRVLPRFARSHILVSNQVLVGQLKEMGFDAELVVKESLGATKDLLEQNYEATVYQGGVTFPVFDALANRYLHSDGQRNYSGYTNNELDALIAKMNVTIDPAARTKVMVEIDENLRKGESVTHFLFYLAGNQIHWPWLRGDRFGQGVAMPTAHMWLTQDSPGRE